MYVLQIPFNDLSLGKRLGGGGFGDVYHGRWLSRDHEVAIKVIKKENCPEQIKEEFIKEASTMYQIRYDHLLNIFGICVEEGNYALVVEYMSLGSLCDVLEKQQTIRLKWPNRWSIAQQITKGINYLHELPEPIIHRDIKSLNIFMTKRDRGFLVKVGDFGLAKVRLGTTSQSPSDGLVGSVPWMAPELFNMERNTKASDVYALGIVFWELATGYFPYENADRPMITEFVTRGDRLPIPPSVPSSFAELISSAWAHEPPQRPTCQQLLVLIKKNYKITEKEISDNDASSPNQRVTSVKVRGAPRDSGTRPRPSAPFASTHGRGQYHGGPPYQAAPNPYPYGPPPQPVGQPYQGAYNSYPHGPPPQPVGQPYQAAYNSYPHGPPPQPVGQPYQAAYNPYPHGPPYQAAPNAYPGGASVIVMKQQQTQQQQPQPFSPLQQTVIEEGSGVNHALCAVICFLTGGLSIPCWIIACLAD